MPPKRKEFLKPKPKGKPKPQEPQSENDFLEAADDHEQAAGKWRAGDQAKATRFIKRAIDVYNEGLKRYPRSFDLAYNKANLEYNITEDERIVAQFGNRTALLEETVNSHRFAISLNPTNTDILFNAAQVLTSLAEVSQEAGSQGSGRVAARALLEDAVSLFAKCLESQQREYEQMQAEVAKAQAFADQESMEDGSVSVNDTQTEGEAENASSSSETPGDWATIEEPLTAETILETCTAQLSALTTLLGLYDISDLSNIEKMASDGTDTATAKIPALINLIDTTPSLRPQDEPKAGPTLSIGASAVEEVTTTPKDDAILAVASFQSTIAELAYRSGRSTSTEYAQTVEQIFSKFSGSTDNASSSSDLAKANIQSAYADALIDLTSALADGTQYFASSPTFLTDVEIQWTALTQAQTFLTQLAAAPYSSLLSASRLADVFLARGDTDLFRFRIALFEQAKPARAKSSMTLVGNAGVFYRGARTYAEKAGATGSRGMADAKAIVAEVLKEVANGSPAIKESWKGRSADVAKVLEQMVEEGIVDRDKIEGVLKCVE